MYSLETSQEWASLVSLQMEDMGKAEFWTVVPRLHSTAQPHMLPIHLGISSLPTRILLPLAILSPAFHTFRQTKFRLFPLTIQTNNHLIRGRKGSEQTT